MPEVDGKKFAYTEKGKKAAAAAKKRKGKKGSFFSKYLSMMPGDKEKYAKDRERQDEIDRGERVVGKKTGTIDTSKGKAKAKKHAKGVQRAGEYVQRREDEGTAWGQRAFSDQMEYEDANTTEEYEKAHKKHMKTRAQAKAAERKLEREYPKSAAHRKSMEKASDAEYDAERAYRDTNPSPGLDLSARGTPKFERQMAARREHYKKRDAVGDAAFMKSRATDKKKAKKKAKKKTSSVAPNKVRAKKSSDLMEGLQHHMMMDTGPLEMKKVKRKKKALPKKIKLKKVPHKGDKTKAQKAGDAEKKRLKDATDTVQGLSHRLVMDLDGFKEKKKKKGNKKTGKKPLPRTPQPPVRS
jgi:hypothetical protein